ncbi:hypothetical protein IV203_037089 [Nitzschia inconspicua]|uniref:BRCT domain-containing protein n=1 Tax=Nitzschia inconspicua TaxID=303405 RepID=A0A9K3LLH3_9STRA|nr:hypothetical protein IV203_037089 [Nitzschia inconspicua]
MWIHELILCRMDKDQLVESTTKNTTTTTNDTETTTTTKKKKKKNRNVVVNDDDDDDDDEQEEEEEEEKLELAQGENWLKLRIITSSSILQTQEEEEDEEEDNEQDEEEEASLTHSQVSQRTTQDPPPPAATTTTATTNSKININRNRRPYLHTSILSIRNIGSMGNNNTGDYSERRRRRHQEDYSASPLQDCYICLDVVDNTSGGGGGGGGGCSLTYRNRNNQKTTNTTQQQQLQSQQSQQQEEDTTTTTLDTILTIKDMRWPSKANDDYCNHGIIIQDNNNDIDNKTEETTCIGIYRNHHDREDTNNNNSNSTTTSTINGWMCLKRRKLTILYPGDRICTDLQVVTLLRSSNKNNNRGSNGTPTTSTASSSSYGNVGTTTDQIKQYTLNGVILEYRPRYVPSTEYSQSQTQHTQATTATQQQQQQVVFSQLSMSQLSQTQEERYEQEEDWTTQQSIQQQQQQQNDEEQTIILHPSLDTQQQQQQGHNENNDDEHLVATSNDFPSDPSSANRQQHPKDDDDDDVDTTTAATIQNNTNDDEEEEEEEEDDDDDDDDEEQQQQDNDDHESVASNDSDRTAPMSQLPVKPSHPPTMVDGRTVSSFHVFSNNVNNNDNKTTLDDIPEQDEELNEEITNIPQQQQQQQQHVQPQKPLSRFDSKDGGTTKNESTDQEEVLLTQPNDDDDDDDDNNNNNKVDDDDVVDDDDDATELGDEEDNMETFPVDDGTSTARSKTNPTTSTKDIFNDNVTELPVSLLLSSSSSPQKLYTQPSQENVIVDTDDRPPPPSPPLPSTPIRVRGIETKATVTSPNLLLQQEEDDDDDDDNNNKVPNGRTVNNTSLPGIENIGLSTTEPLSQHEIQVATDSHREENKTTKPTITSNNENHQSIMLLGNNSNSIVKEELELTVTDTTTTDGQDPTSDKKKSPSKMSATDMRVKGMKNSDDTQDDDEDITDPEDDIQPNNIDGTNVITNTTKQAGNRSIIDPKSNAASQEENKDSNSNINDDEPSTPQNEESVVDTIHPMSLRRQRKSQRTRASKVQEEHTSPTQSSVHSTSTSTRRGKRKASSPQDERIVPNRKSRRTSTANTATTTTKETEVVRHETMLTNARHRYNQIFQSALDTGVVTIAVSSLSKSDVTILDYLVSKKSFMGGIKLKVSDDIETDTTVCVVPHVVSNNKRRDVRATIRSKKAMKAALLGIPIATPDWIKLCKKHGEIVLPESFIQTLPTKSDAIEVNGDANYGVTRLAAEWKIRPDTPQLPFSNTFVYLCGNFKMPRNDLIDLLEEGCASMLLTPNATSSKLMELMKDTTTETSSSSKPLVAIVCGDSRVSFTKSLEQDINTAAVDTTIDVVVVGWQWVLESITCGKAMPASLFPPVAKKELWELCLGHI